MVTWKVRSENGHAAENLVERSDNLNNTDSLNSVNNFNQAKLINDQIMESKRLKI